MEIVLNGTSQRTESTTVEALVAELGLKRGTVLVEHNRVALRPDEWGTTTLRQGDRVEMLKIAAGG
jgi:thiamine biosynthesis protein ThiS